MRMPVRAHPTRPDVAPAIAYDSRPSSEFVVGQRYAGISWDYPLRVTARVNVEIDCDPVALILAYADEYADFESDFSDDKPLAFITHLIEEGVDFMGFRGHRRVAQDRVDVEDVSEYPSWTETDTERIERALENRVDPNQESLDFAAASTEGTPQ